ncbi:Phosphatidylinositol-4-phosphate 5-kinase [Podila horticola]|nr:Phosphatidylinositol-4-phosphate 5-kinase [Podila horticola]
MNTMDTTADTTGFYSDLLDQGNGVYSTAAAVPFHPKAGLHKVSEGTQTQVHSPSPPSSPKKEYVYPDYTNGHHTINNTSPPRFHQEQLSNSNNMNNVKKPQEHLPLQPPLQQKLATPSTPPRISSLSPTKSPPSPIQLQHMPLPSGDASLSHPSHMPVDSNTVPPRFSSLHQTQPNGTNGAHAHQFAQGFPLEPSPTLSATETSTTYAPIKLTDVSSTIANMTTLTTLPIPPTSSPPVSISAPSPPPISTDAHAASLEVTQHYLQQQQQQVPRSPSVASPGGAGAGGGYQASLAPTKQSPGKFTTPTRASTMDVRKHSGSMLLGESSRQQPPHDPQAESSSRAKRRQIYRRNTYSADLASASFHRSDDEMELDELEYKRRMEVLKKSSSRRMSKRKKDKDEDHDRVLIGTRIGEDHVNYVLMYNMLTGIRVSVSRCNAKPQRALVDEDFTSAHKLAFDITGNELTPSSKYDFKFKDYAPWVFRHLREDFHIDASDYLVSLTSKYILSELGSPGKSGSFFYFSQDYRFIIKTIHHAEHKFMRKILKDYFNHVKQNPHTLLCRFFGLHRVKLPHGRKIHFVVMGNVFPPNRDIHETYDLKGSTLGRAISDEELNNNPRATQKDLNWVNRNRKMELGPERRHLFVEQTKRDVELLARLNIMDYSLLVGIHDIERGNKDNIRDNTLKVFHPDTSKSLAREPSRRDKRESKVNALRMAVKVSDPVALGPSTLPSDSFSERRHCIFYADDGGLLSTNENNDRGEDLYYLGIIDILTPYNYVKKIEHYWKSLSQDKHAISSVNPIEYAQRFLSFMIHAIKVNHDVISVLDKNQHPHSE